MAGEDEQEEETASTGFSAPLIARQYQKELFKKAVEGNVIACVDTGSGKTLVAAMLLEHMLNLEEERLQAFPREDRRRKIALFLVNLVPLVHQQAAFIDTRLNNRDCVEVLYGDAQGSQQTSPNYWTRIIENDSIGVVVCTAQCVLNAIVHAYLKLEDVCLLIFDEAHHAIGDNPFARIMKYYRLLSPSARPKIFGMTASPLLTKSTSLRESALELESVLDASLLTVPHSAREELLRHLQRPTELVIEYDRSPPWDEGDQPAPSLPKVRSQLIAAMPESADFAKVLGRMDFYWQTFGPIFGDLAWLSSKDDLRRQALQKDHFAKELENEDLINPAVRKNPRIRGSLAQSAICRRSLASILDDIAPPERITLTPENASDHLLRFVQILECFHCQAKDFCGIVFCNRRVTALALKMLVDRTPSLESFIHCEALIGHTHGLTGAHAMSWVEQERVLSRLRRRAPTNLVIATSVLEEGLDIRPVNCVIRFDLPSHHVGYVQSRGRARSANSTYILMVEQNSLKHIDLLQNVVHAESMMQEWLINLPQDRLVALDLEETSQDLIAMKLDEMSGVLSQSLFDARTGARLFPNDAIALLNHYVALLRSDDFGPSGPEIEISGANAAWSATVRLPANCPIDSVCGPTVRSKVAAKRLAAFETCRQLHAIKHLNEHLAPREKPRLHAAQVSALEYDLTGVGQRVESTPQNMVSFQRRIPSVFSRSSIYLASSTHDDIVLYSTTVSLPGQRANSLPMRSLALITKSPIPSERLRRINLVQHNEPLRSSNTAHSWGRSRKILWTSKQLQQAIRFTQALINLLSPCDLRGDRWPYLLVPLKSDNVTLAWDEIDSLSERPLKKISTDHPSERHMADWLVIDTLHFANGSGRTYCGLNFDHSLTPCDPIPEFLSDTAPNTEATTFWDLFAKSRRKENSSLLTEQLELGQPMMIARRVPRRLKNYLESLNEGGARSVAKEFYLIPQFHFIHDIRASVYEAARLMPSVLTRVEQDLNAIDLNDKLFDGKLSIEKLVSALTAPGARHETSYELLEYLGDCLLKAVIGAYVFACSDESVEGFLHLARRGIVSNTCLVNNTRIFNLGEYLYTTSWTRKTWRPPLLQRAGKAEAEAEQMNHLSAKMIADVVESLIGAGADTPHHDATRSLWINVDLALTVMLRLGVLNDERIVSFGDIAQIWYDQIEPKAQSYNWNNRVDTGRLHVLEQRLGYKFCKPYLALEALTHPGHLHATLPSYQRLEFLGDGLLDLFLNAWMYKEFPELNQGQLTRLKGRAVSNQALSALCVTKGLHKCLQADWHTSLYNAVQIAATDFRLAQETSDEYWTPEQRSTRRHVFSLIDRQASEKMLDIDDEESLDVAVALKLSDEAPLLHYWADCSEVKALADIVEATLGAIFVDSGFDFNAAWTLFEQYHLPWFKRYCTPAAFQQREAWEKDRRTLQELVDTSSKSEDDELTARNSAGPADSEVADEASDEETGSAHQSNAGSGFEQE